MVYVSRWFDRRRGTAIALISSGQYIAGMIWPSLIGYGIARYGWQTAMLAYGGVVLALILPMLALLRPAPEPLVTPGGQAGLAAGGPRAGHGAQRDDGADLPGRFPVLRADGDAGLAPGRVLRRHRHRRTARRWCRS